jgi:uncharacterized membrane protein
MQIRSRDKVLEISIIAVFTALVAITTFSVRVPIPATGGYINIGDVIIFVAALSFGWLVGGIAGGLGSAIADIIGFPIFAPFTLVIKGLEGLIAGLISNGESFKRDVLAWGAGSMIVIAGYFIVEAYVLRLGTPAALIEIPGNFFQVVFGGVFGVPLSRLIRRRIRFFKILRR